jgi:hypothetical protein
MIKRGAQIFQKPTSKLKIIGARKVTWSKFNTEGPADIRRHRRDYLSPGFVHSHLFIFLNIFSQD